MWPWRTTSSQRRGLLRLIAVATEERLPLVPLLEAWAADERGVQQLRVARLAWLLKGGRPLPEAVEEAPGALRDEDVLAIRFGAQSGTLAGAVRDALDDSTRGKSESVAASNALMYFCVVLAIATAIVTFLQIKIVPAFVAILDDFNVDQPRVLKNSIAMGEAVSKYWYLVALAGLAVAWLIFSLRGGRFLRNAIVGRLSGMARDLRSAEVLRKLGLAIQAGRPIPGALSTLARYHYDARLRHKLLYCRNEVEQGADVWQSLTAAGLLAPAERELMRTADRVGNRPWALTQIAALKTRRSTRRWQRLSNLVLPALVLVLGGLVLFQALSVFVPLMQLTWLAV
jgi:type II secretory pathway component PulF